MPIFDWTISLGNVLTIFSFVGTGVVVFLNAYTSFNKLQLNFTNMDKRMILMEEELKKQTEILINQAAQRERMVSLERRVDDLFKVIHKVALGD